MEDKTFELLEKMYAEFSARFYKIETNINGITTDIQSFKNNVLQMEQDHGKKLQVLFDGHIKHEKHLDTIEEKIDSLSNKVDRHDIKIQVIEGGQKKKAK
jgi:hypothetical protein